MDWLTFITKIVEALAWPLVVLYVLIKFKEKLIALIPKLNKLEAGPLKAEFREETAKVLAEIETVRIQENVPPNLADVPTDDNQARFHIDHVRPKKKPEQLTKSFTFAEPSAAILIAWDNVEIALLNRVAELGVYVPPQLTDSPTAWLRALRKEERISHEVYMLVNELYELRSRVAHGKLDPTSEAAWDYVQATERFVPLIQKLKPQDS